MICSECWTSVAQGGQKCPRCGAKVTGAPPSLRGLLKSYPWVVALLTVSVLVTLWAATRRAPAPEPIPEAVEPAAEIPPPTPEREPEPYVFPAPAPEAAPAPAPAPEAPRPSAEEQPPPPPSGAARQNADGTWSTGGP